MSVGSAINDTTRIAGGALGVAVLGSAPGQRVPWGHGLGRQRPARPAREVAQDSLAGALAVAERVGDGRLAAAAQDAFVSGHAHRGAGRRRRRAGRRAGGGRVPARGASSAREVVRHERPRSDAEATAAAPSRDRRRSPMTVGARPPGRPRSAEADEAILRAALELLAEDGYRRADDGARARALRRRQGDALPPLRLQGGARRGPRSCTSTATSRCREDTGSMRGRLRGDGADRSSPAPPAPAR